MNTSDTVTSQRDELALLLQHHIPPLPNRLDITPWVAMSLLQKSLRRGEVGHALRAAATLLESAPSNLWRRLVVAVYEDFGLGSLDLIAPVLIASSGKDIREKLGGDWFVGSAIVEKMAEARKCRASDDLLMTAIGHPRYESNRLSWAYRRLPELMRIATSDGDIISRAISLFYAIGTDRYSIPAMRKRKGDVRYAFESMREAGFPFCVIDLAEWGCTRCREPLPAFMALVSREVPKRSDGYQPTDKDDDFLPIKMIGDIPSWCLDYYSRPGRAAIRAFLQRDTATGMWIRRNVPKPNRLEFLGGLVFRVDGGLMRRRLQWPLGQQLRKMMEIEASGFGVDDAAEVLDLLRNDLPVLNEERCYVL